MSWRPNLGKALAIGVTVGLAQYALQTQAKAADLGSDCCADLEARVAELEATTVRKGNRKVSLELSGQIDKILLFWNDGKQSDVYVTDNAYSTSRFRMRGSAQMAPDWRAGFYLEWEARDASSNLVDQTTEQNRNLETSLRARQENVFVESEYFGRVTLGLQNTATKDLTLINLGGGLSDPENYHAASFFIRDNTLPLSSWVSVTGFAAPTTAGALPNSTRLVAPTLQSTNNTLNAPNPATAISAITAFSVGGLNWLNLTNAMDSQRQEAVRFDTVSFWGFLASVAWGQNDFWDVALRYQKEWNSIRFAGGVGYQWWGERSLTQGAPFATNDIFLGSNQSNQPNTFAGPSGGVPGSMLRPTSSNVFGGETGSVNSKIEVVEGNFSAMHIPTGLYVTFSAGTRHIDNPAVPQLYKDATYYYTQWGITKRFLPMGATTFYGEYGNYDNYAASAVYFQTWSTSTGRTLSTTRVLDSNVNRWGAGFAQAFDSAALEIFGNFLHYDADITTTSNLTPSTSSAAATTGFTTREDRAPMSWDAFYTGARLKF
jgi:hypothetical protein